MANVTILLTVDVADLWTAYPTTGPYPPSSAMPQYCRLSQFGGEIAGSSGRLPVGAFIIRDPVTPTNDISTVLKNDTLIWAGISDAGPGTYQIQIWQIIGLPHSFGVLTYPTGRLPWPYGISGTCSAGNVAIANPVGYKIQFNITDIENDITYGPYTLDPKIRVNPSPSI